MSSLYERLGGLDALESVADAFVARAAADDRINQKFARSDVPRLKATFVEQLCEATGGPCHYTARSMREAHNGMGVTGGEFNAFMEDFTATLSDAGVAKADQHELISLITPPRNEIVEIGSPQTATPLPDTYQPAPPLQPMAAQSEWRSLVHTVQG